MNSNTLPQLQERKMQICNHMAGITTMRRGTLNEVYKQQKLKDGTIVKRGPFYNVTTTDKTGKTKTTAIPKKDLEEVRQEVENYKRFRALSEEYIEVCEKITLLTSDADESKKN